MTAVWQEVTHITDGESVRASVATRPDEALANRTEYLKERLEEAQLGRSIVLTDESLDPATALGMAVYYNETNGRFEGGLARTQVDASGVLVAKNTSDIIGVVLSKTNDSLGDLLIGGRGEIPGISSVIEGNNAIPGRYYLSNTTPGWLVHQTERPAMGVPVLFLLPGDVVIVAPYVKDFVEQHVHCRYELNCRPSGIHVLPDTDESRHQIQDPDADMAGWLPADHAVFEGNAPVGAMFGYNWRADPNLRASWPPIPVEAAALLFDKNGDGAVEVPLGWDGLASIDEYGIWWLSNTYDDVPWPRDYVLPTSLGASSSSAQPENPRTKRMRLYVHFSRQTYLTDKNVITSLSHLTGSPIQLVDGQGRAASRGDLYLQYSDAAAVRTYPAVFGKRDNVSEQYLQNALYYGMPAGQKSYLWAKITLPDRNLPASPRLKLQLWLLGRSSGTLPQLEVTCRRLPQPDAVGSISGIPSASPTVTIATAFSVTIDKYVLCESDAFEVSPGDEVLVQLHRTNADAYGAECGILSLKGVVVGA